MYLYRVYVRYLYFFLRARTHTRTHIPSRIRRASTSIYRRIGDRDLAGPPRLDSTCDYSIHRPVKSTSARCVPWSFSFPFSLSLSFDRSLSILSLSFSLIPTYAPSLFFCLSRSRIYTALPFPFSPSPPDITIFCLSSSRTVSLPRFSVSVRRAATLRSRSRCAPRRLPSGEKGGGERLGAIRCDNCP